MIKTDLTYEEALALYPSNPIWVDGNAVYVDLYKAYVQNWNLNPNIEYALPHADIEARPPRLYPIDSVPYRIMCGWNGYAWGNDGNSNQIIRVDSITREATALYTFTEVGTTISAIFAGRNALFVLTKLDNRFSLYRTTDGTTVTLVHDVGRDPDGTTHWQHVQLLFPGLTQGKIAGEDALMLATYNIMDTEGGMAGTQGSAIYLAYSLDDGVTWTRLNTWNWDYGTETGETTIRHFHACRYDQWRDCWWIAGGDTDNQSCVIRWDSRTLTEIGNVSPATIQAGGTTGWDCRTGSQRWRTVDILITEDWIETMTDTVSVSLGGIWRCKPDFSQSHRVDHSTKGKQKEGWFALLASNGVHLWIDNVREDAVNAAERYIGIYASANGNRYYEIGRMQVIDAVKAIPLSIFELNGKIWVCNTNPAGKGLYDTTIMEFKGVFREERSDNISPTYFVDFVNGNDSNNGYSKTTAWKTTRNCFLGNKLTYGARVVLTSGNSTENGANDIVYNANTNPAPDTTRHIQISGQGKDQTTIIISGATEGWRGAAARIWNVELADLTIKQSDTTKALLWDNSTATAGSGWTLRDARVGDLVTGSTNALYARASSHKAIRTEILNLSINTKYAVKAETTGSVRLEACVIKSGRSSQAGDGVITAIHCEFRDCQSAVSFLINSTSTTPPLISNCIFDNTGTQAGIQEDSATVTLDSTNCYGNVFQTAVGANIPDPILPFAEILDRDVETLIPFSWSALVGISNQTPLLNWDFYGRPYRKNPTIGACEII